MDKEETSQENNSEQKDTLNSVKDGGSSFNWRSFFEDEFKEELLASQQVRNVFTKRLNYVEEFLDEVFADPTTFGKFGNASVKADLVKHITKHLLLPSAIPDQFSKLARNERESKLTEKILQAETPLPLSAEQMLDYLQAARTVEDTLALPPAQDTDE